MSGLSAGFRSHLAFNELHSMAPLGSFHRNRAKNAYMIFPIDQYLVPNGKSRLVEELLSRYNLLLAVK